MTEQEKKRIHDHCDFAYSDCLNGLCPYQDGCGGCSIRDDDEDNTRPDETLWKGRTLFVGDDGRVYKRLSANVRSKFPSEKRRRRAHREHLKRFADDLCDG